MKIDVILTSCGRFDLLNRTLDRFMQYNTWPLGKFTIYDDKGVNKFSEHDYKAIAEIEAKYPFITFLCGDKPIGQIAAIDYLMQFVKTRYYMHLEDDWEFYRSGFVEDSIEVLAKRPDVMQCWLREQRDTNGHPVYKMDGELSLMSTKYEWKGFSFNPAVRRLSDYVPYGSIASFDPRNPAKAEQLIGDYYHSKGMVAAILEQGYVRHIGDGRGIR